MKIVDIKHKALRKKSIKVKKVDKKIKDLIKEMKSTLLKQKDPEGVGLAAPQIGKNLQLFIMHYPEEGLETKVVMNPKIVEQKNIKKIKKEKDLLEGCLSLPHYYGPVSRDNYIKIKFLNEDGERVEEEFSGFSAHIVQHEIDHLNGRLFIDHILENDSKLYFIQNDDVEEVEL